MCSGSSRYAAQSDPRVRTTSLRSRIEWQRWWRLKPERYQASSATRPHFSRVAGGMLALLAEASLEGHQRLCVDPDFFLDAPLLGCQESLGLR
jgi:hypothetical protein